MLTICATGNLGRDPELKTVKDTQVAQFSIAANTGRDETTWIKCSVWGTRADVVMKYFTKGSNVSISGSGKLVQFEKKDGSPGSNVEVRVNDFSLPAKVETEEAPKKPSW